MDNIKFKNKKEVGVNSISKWILAWLKIDKDWLVTSIVNWDYDCIKDPKSLPNKDKVHIIYECEFDLYFKNWKFSLEDRQQANLWDIEDETFNNLTEVIERIEDRYICDYFGWSFKWHPERKPQKYDFKLKKEEAKVFLEYFAIITEFSEEYIIRCKEKEHETDKDEWGILNQEDLKNDKLKTFELDFVMSRDLEEDDVYSIEDKIKEMIKFDKTKIVDITESTKFISDLSFEDYKEIMRKSKDLNEKKSLDPKTKKENYYTWDYWASNWVMERHWNNEFFYNYDEKNHEIILKYYQTVGYDWYYYVEDLTDEEKLDFKKSLMLKDLYPKVKE